MADVELVPKRVTDHVVFAQKLGIRRQRAVARSPLAVLRVRRIGRRHPFLLLRKLLSRPFEVRATEQVALAHQARIDAGRVDGKVHLGVGRVEEDLFEPGPQLGRGQDGKRHVVHQTDGFRFGRRRRSCEEGNGAEESRREDEGVGVEDPEDVMFRFPVASDQVVDFGIHADALLACETLVNKRS